MRSHPRALRYFALFLVALSVAFSFSTTTQGQEPQPDYGKLDAALLGLVSPSLPGNQAVSEDVRDHLAQFTSYAFTSTDGTEYVDGLIKTSGSLDGLRNLGVIVQSVVGEVVAARMPVETLSQLTSLSNVEFIEASRQLRSFNDTSVPSTGAPIFHNAGIDGTGAIVAVIDTDIDFTHNDFRNADGTTRMKFLCDQIDAPLAGDATCPGNGSPTGGTLWTEAQINTHLAGTPTVRQTFTQTHGSHVTGSAAGNDSTYGGMAPGADIIFVKSDLVSVNIINSLSFIDQKAGELGLPYVINMSFGGHFGPHDGTDAMSLAINSLVGAGKPGKAVVAAAGNEGASKIHASADLAGSNQTIQIDVPVGAVQFLVEVWYDGTESFSFGFADSQGGGQNNIGSGSSTSLCVTNYCYQVSHSFNQPEHNDSKQIELFVSSPSGGNPITATGTWSFTLSGAPTSNGVFHAWCAAGCDFPNGDSDFTVGEPASAANVITVGAINNKACWNSLNGTFCYTDSPSQGDIAGFSSKGPTRDGRIKPDIVAPGEGIASALSSNGTVSNDIILPGGTHFITQGTSMASPHVAGAVALYLAENPLLDAAEILQTLKDNAIEDAQTGTVPNNSAGYGKLNIAPLVTFPVVTFPDANLEAAIREALSKPTGDITTDDMAGLTSLDASISGIQDLTGLEHASNLTYLRLAANQISDISALASLTNLTELSLYRNQISDISALVENAGLSQGDSVALWDNPLSRESLSTHIPALQARGVDVSFTPTLFIEDATVGEGDGTVTLTITLIPQLNFAVTVDYVTSDGTAVAPGDYTHVSGTATIPAGATSTTFSVSIVDDSVEEPDETFTVTLSNPTNAQIAADAVTSTVSILDDDGTIVAETTLRPTLDDDDVAVVELRVERLRYAGGELTFDSPNGFQSFDATLTFDTDAVEILDVRAVTEFAGNTTFDSTSTSGQLTISGSITDAPADIGPLVLARIGVRLTGGSDADTQLTLTSLQVTEATSATVFDQEAQVSDTYRRGDVRADGQVRATDRLFLTQCLLGLRDYGTEANECHPINAASIAHDGPTGDMPTETDGLYISELVVELRDANFDLVP